MRKILFLTGTRADFGKLKPLMQAVEASDDYDCLIFVTGMHLMSRYGLTGDEVHKAGFKNIYTFINQVHGEPMDLILANTIGGLSRYVQESKPDLIVVHGDRVETLAGAIVGALQGVLVAHIEGGEVSGTVDELIRHAVTKLSHLHFVANVGAAERLRQLGEDANSINITGSPDIDVMVSPDLPDLDAVKERYDIEFETYGIVLYHPVTTEQPFQKENAENLVDALVASERDFVVVFPNNDEGSDDILAAYERLEGNPHFRVFPSLRFEYFLSLLKHAACIVGNSSAGVRQAPAYGVPTINVGTRQMNRFAGESIVNVDCSSDRIRLAIQHADGAVRTIPNLAFGDGRSTERFMECLAREQLWNTPSQKVFCDVVAAEPPPAFGPTPSEAD